MVGFTKEQLEKAMTYRPPCGFRVGIPGDMREALMTWLSLAIGRDAEWVDGYEGVAEWLTDNKGKGLVLMGPCGLGKTEIGRNIIPSVVRNMYSYIISTYSAVELATDPDEVMKHRLVMIDDVGKEDASIDYGRRRYPVLELCDKAEKDGTLLILTTNLTPDEIVRKYGDHTLDRLKKITKLVILKGKSKR